MDIYLNFEIYVNSITSSITFVFINTTMFWVANLEETLVSFAHKQKKYLQTQPVWGPRLVRSCTQKPMKNRSIPKKINVSMFKRFLRHEICFFFTSAVKTPRVLKHQRRLNTLHRAASNQCRGTHVIPCLL